MAPTIDNPPSWSPPWACAFLLDEALQRSERGSCPGHHESVRRSARFDLLSIRRQRMTTHRGRGHDDSHAQSEEEKSLLRSKGLGFSHLAPLIMPTRFARDNHMESLGIEGFLATACSPWPGLIRRTGDSRRSARAPAQDFRNIASARRPRRYPLAGPLRRRGRWWTATCSSATDASALFSRSRSSSLGTVRRTSGR